MNRSIRWRWPIGLFLLAGFLAVNQMLNHFYVSGAFMMDSGYFAFMTSHATTWPLPSMPSLGGTFFDTHFTPVFYLFSAGYQILRLLPGELPDAVWFSLLQGLWPACIAASTFFLLRQHASGGPGRRLLIALIALGAAFNGVFLAAMGLPHPEIAIPALLLVFFALLASGHVKTALLALFIGLLVRQDAGLHYFGLFSLLTIYLYISGRMRLDKRTKFYAGLALVCLGYSLLVILFQRTFYGDGDNALARVYLGDPAFAHLNAGLIMERLKFFLQQRLYIVLPVLWIVLLAFYTRRWILLVGIFAVVPWTALSLLAVSSMAGRLDVYYAFPIAIALLWPIVVHALFLVRPEMASSRSPAAENAGFLTGLFIIFALSIAIYPFSNHGNGDPRRWRDFAPGWIGKIDSSHAALNGFFAANPPSRFIHDDTVASLFSSTVTAAQWRFRLEFSRDELAGLDGIVFLPGGWLFERIKNVVQEAEFEHVCRLPGSEHIVASRLPALEYCEPLLTEKQTDYDMREIHFDLLPGWSYKEPSGRWTIGPEARLPAMPLYAHQQLCLEAHGFLPTPDSRIRVRATASGKLLGEFFYEADAGGKTISRRCVPIPAELHAAAEPVSAHLAISGFSSPWSHGRSNDERPLGVFVRGIHLE